MGKKEDAGRGVTKLTSIINLNSLNGTTELSRHPCKEMRKVGEGVRLTAKGKGPEVVREVIQNDKMVLHTKDARNGGCLEVTVDKVEVASSAEQGRGKG
jgi:hypothetical protein